jgi:hypothetical protein
MLISQMLKDELTPFDLITLRYEVMFYLWRSWDAYTREDSKASNDPDALFRSMFFLSMAGLPVAQA